MASLLPFVPVRHVTLLLAAVLVAEAMPVKLTGLVHQNCRRPHSRPRNRRLLEHLHADHLLTRETDFPPPSLDGSTHRFGHHQQPYQLPEEGVPHHLARAAAQHRAGDASPSAECPSARAVKRRSTSSSPERCTRRRFAEGFAGISAIIGPTPYAFRAHGSSIDKPKRIYDIDTNMAPDSTKYDPDDPDLYKASQLLQKALNAESVVEEEKLWTEIITAYSKTEKSWTNDIVGRAYGNRGNSRARQGKFTLALEDYDTSITMCPWAVDPVLNRGVALEALGQYEEAIDAYQAVLRAQPNDPAGWNNLGNANMGIGEYHNAVRYYENAVKLAPEFSFAQANLAIAMYAAGERNQATRKMRTLLRRYPDFDDMRAALVAALWAQDLRDNAEIEWLRVRDERYNNPAWLRKDRRWPEPLIEDMKKFLAKGSYAR